MQKNTGCDWLLQCLMPPSSTLLLYTTSVASGGVHKGGARCFTQASHGQGMEDGDTMDSWPRAVAVASMIWQSTPWWMSQSAGGADLLRSLVVEWLKPSEGPTLRSCVRHMFISLRTLLASTLPSSTPHWSKELMPQMKPCKPLVRSGLQCPEAQHGFYTPRHHSGAEGFAGNDALVLQLQTCFGRGD